jgi:hypothetical protein
MRVAFAVLAVLALVASGQEKPLPKATEAWKWTIEQRIAARLDPGGMAERRQIHIRRIDDQPDYNPSVVVIEGESNPELFMPHELMTFLISDSDPRYPTGRLRYEPILPQFGWKPETFWNEVRSVAADYIQLQEENPRPSNDVSRELCALRATTLAEMRRRYPRFDEFLYVAVAPGRTYFSDDVRPASWIRWLESGCK